MSAAGAAIAEDEPHYRGEFQVDVDAFMLLVADAGTVPDMQQVRRGDVRRRGCIWQP